jgi:hypothetical protein
LDDSGFCPYCGRINSDPYPGGQADSDADLPCPAEFLS